jgi:hypothetical protein
VQFAIEKYGLSRKAVFEKRRKHKEAQKVTSTRKYKVTAFLLPYQVLAAHSVLLNNPEEAHRKEATMAENSNQWNAVAVECTECGLRAKVSATEHSIIDVLSKCTHKEEWGHCEHLRLALSAARQSLEKCGRPC